jgi:Xaa-Pro aminopeptidase
MLTNLKSKMKTQDIKALLVNDLINIKYLTGFTGTSAILLVTLDKGFLFTDFRYIEQAQKQAKSVEIVEVKKKAFTDIGKLLDSEGIDHLGFDPDKLTYGRYMELKNTIKQRLNPIKGVIEELRMVKQNEELALMRKAAKISDKAFEYILPKIRPGIKERKLALDMEFFMKENGAEALSFETIIASGERSAMPHGTASERKLKKNDLVVMDFGCVYKGYCSDMTRTVVVGNPSHKQKKIYEIVLNAQENALSNLRAGIKCNEADRLARQIIKNKGFGQNFGHSLGHGVGLEIHEQPILAPSNCEELKTGMTVTVEPGIYIKGFGGVRIEDLVVIKKNGIENLTKSTKALICVG